MFMNRRKFLLNLGVTGLTLPFATNLISASAQAATGSFEDYKKQQLTEFQQYKEALERDFLAYQQAIDNELNKFKSATNKLWGDFNIGNAKVFVSYSDDLKTRRIVDFEQGKITVQQLAPVASRGMGAQLSKELIQLATSTTNDAFNNSSLDKRLEQAAKQASTNTTQAKPSNQPLIADILTGKSQPTKVETEQAMIKQVKEGKATSQAANQDGLQVYSFSVPLNTANLSSKAQTYKPLALKYAQEEKIDPALVLAIMHSESSFNPVAKSHVPAYGLMQIVPTSAGKDASQKVYGKQLLLSPSYLYNAENNIKMGCAYLNILNYRYLKAITHPESRLYCVISAYNTGSGNVAKAFTGATNVNTAATKINQMTPSQVYQHLIKNLPYEETRNYLKVVTPRYQGYQQEFA